MKNFLSLSAALLLLFLVSCSNENSTPPPADSRLIPTREKYVENIKKLEAEMHASMELNNVTAALAIKAYDDFSKKYPDDSLTPDFLFKAGEIATAAKQYKQALMYYQTIEGKYPRFKLSDVSLYLQGFLLDNYLNDDKTAKGIYEEVMAKYPNSTYAADAKAAINNLGKSDEELIKEFKKKNGQK